MSRIVMFIGACAVIVGFVRLFTTFGADEENNPEDRKRIITLIGGGFAAVLIGALMGCLGI